MLVGKSRENFKNIFPGLSRTNKQNSRTFQDSKKKSRIFPGCGNPDNPHPIEIIFDKQNEPVKL